MVTTHYARLGVAHEASTEQIRQAYRTLARVHHPDRIGSSTSAEMLEINEAWRILSDPVLRRAYDTRLASNLSHGSSGAASHQPMSSSTYSMNSAAYGRARFPWKFVLGFFVVVTAIIIVMGALTEQGQPAGVDNIIRVGSCIDVDRQLREAREVSCDGPYDGRVQQMVPFDSSCPRNTEAFRDRQGLGLVCIATS
jgi:molecular chaperone DnaJ